MSFKSWDKIQITLDDKSIVTASAPVIISASRSTDIPAFYSKWFFNRLKKGYARWVNPFNQKPIYVSFTKTQAIVFWTKNPKPILPYLKYLNEKNICYYFHYTLNNYQQENLEPNLPSLNQRIETFKLLSNITNRNKVIWRFDPLLLAQNITVENLLERIEYIGQKLKGYTKRLIFSFADISKYKKVTNSFKRHKIIYKDFNLEQKRTISIGIKKICDNLNIIPYTCAEDINLFDIGIKPSSCIDDNLMKKICNNNTKLMDFFSSNQNKQIDLFATKSINKLKDYGQRKNCNCIVSKDIGSYNTCDHLCKYCYANTSENIVKSNLQKHNPNNESII